MEESGVIVKAAVGVLLALVGAGLIARREWLVRTLEPTLFGAVRISVVTCAVAGLALLLAGYHVVVYALEIEDFRLPAPAAAAVAVLGVAGSVVADWLDTRLAARREGDSEDRDRRE